VIGEADCTVTDGVANEPRPDLVQFVTMQELSAIYDRIALADP